MISFWKLTEVLQAEWRRLESEESGTQFVKGIIQGLKLANAIAKDIRDQAKEHPSPNPSGNKNSYLKAIRTAHDQLKRCERSRAIATLESVIEKVEAEAKIKAVAL